MDNGDAPCTELENMRPMQDQRMTVVIVDRPFEVVAVVISFVDSEHCFTDEKQNIYV